MPDGSLMVIETDYGTPAPASSAGTRMITLQIDGAAVTVPEGTSVMRAAMEVGTRIPKLCALRHAGLVRQLPHVPGGGRGPQRDPGQLHHASGRGHQGLDADRAPEAHPPRRDGAVYQRPPAGLPDLRRQWRLRAAGHCRRGRPARGPLRLRGRESPGRAKGPVQPVFRLRPQQVHRLLPLRPRLRGGAGHLRADGGRPRLRQQDRRQPERAVPGQRVRPAAAPACRPAPPRP